MFEPPSLALDAVSTLTPRRGEFIEVVEGTALAFAVDGDSRRSLIAAVPAGECLFGLDPMSDGLQLLVVGLPGTNVLVQQLDADNPSSGLPVTSLVETWARRLGEAASDQHWPAGLLPIGTGQGVLGVGDRLGAGRADAGVTWVRLRTGAASLCDYSAAVTTAQDPAIPLPGSTWLTACESCEVEVAQAPAELSSLMDSLQAWGQLVLAAVAQRRQQADRRVLQQREFRDAWSSTAIGEAIEVLTASVSRGIQDPTALDPTLAARITSAVTVARACGLSVSDAAVTRAVEALVGGGDPIESIASSASARVRPVTLQAGWWTREGTPLIVERATGPGQPPVTMALLWRRGWKLRDASGELWPVDRATAGQISRNAIELRPVLPGRAADTRDLLRMALDGSFREWLVIGLVTVLIAGLSFLTPILLGQLAALFIDSAPGSAYAALFTGLLLLVVAGASWQAVRALALLRARSRAVAVAAGSVWERIMRLPARWHADRSLGDRFVQANAVNSASASISDETLARLLDTATVLGGLTAIATINSGVLASLAALMLIQLAVVAHFLRLVSARAMQRVDASAEAAGILIETLSSVARLRVSGAESRAFLRWAQAQAGFARADQDLRRTTMLQGVVLSAWPFVALLVLILAIDASGASFGDFITAQAAVTAATAAMASLAIAGNASAVARQSLRKASPALAAIPEGTGHGTLPGILDGALEVHDVVFRYGPDLPPTLKAVTLRVEPGEQVAIVGPSGCGKTTLIRVILGLEEAESGMILIDGRDISGLDRTAVRRQIGSVLQSARLLPVSIRENVAMGRPMTQAQIWDALDAAAIGDEVRSLGMGLQTPVTDSGGTLSGGQRQRILIARALAGKPRILVLDEATSSLDNASQAAIVASMQALKVTRLVVAHRLSTIRQADRIVVMDAGAIVDEGTFADLAGRPGPFQRLIDRQRL